MSLELTSSAESRQISDVVARIEMALATAVLMPGQTYTKARVAALSGTTDSNIDEALALLAEEGYLTMADQQVTVCTLKVDEALRSLDQICALEIEIVRLAIERISDEQKGQLQHLMKVTRRGAMIGDIATILAADRGIESVIGQASGSPAKAAELLELKREFKRAWCYTHRFRNVDSFVEERSTMINAINIGDVDILTESIRRFFKSLPEQFAAL